MNILYLQRIRIVLFQSGITIHILQFLNTEQSLYLWSHFELYMNCSISLTLLFSELKPLCHFILPKHELFLACIIPPPVFVNIQRPCYSVCMLCSPEIYSM